MWSSSRGPVHKLRRSDVAVMLRNAPGRHADVMRLPDLLHTRRTAAVQQGQCVPTYLYGMPAWRRIKHDIFGWPTANQWGVQTRH